MTSKYLVLFDADNIAGYVFDTGRLKEIRGGSALVREATSVQRIEALVRLVNDADKRIVYAGGGAGLVRFSSRDAAESFAQHLRSDYRRKTIDGSISVAVTEAPADFIAAVAAAHVTLRRLKSAQPQVDRQPLAGAHSAICVSCGRRPVQAIYTTPKDPLCSVCWARRKADDEAHQYMQIGHSGENTRRTSLEDMQNTGNDLARAFLATAQEPSWRDAWLPDTMDELGNASRPRNYVAFLHADGNRMGEHLRAFLDSLRGKSWVEMEDAYGAFSMAIAQATQTAVVEALLDACVQPVQVKNNDFAPFDPILFAGDDLVLLVAAHHALDVAATFCDVFEREMSAAAAQLGYHQTMTTAVGVVLAHAKHPILQLQRQAKDLLRSAKTRVAEQRKAGQDVSAVDFEVVTAPVIRPLATQRRHAYQVDEGDGALYHLTRRPYTAADLRQLLEMGRRLKRGRAADAVDVADATDPERRSYPRSQLHGLYNAIFQGSDQAKLQGARAILRVNAQQRKQLLAFADAFDARKEFPWSSRNPADDKITTPVTDLVEIFDFLHDA